MYTPDIPAASLPGGLKPAAFAGVHSQAILTDYDLYSPQELTVLFERHGYKPGFAMMLDVFGFSKPGNGDHVGHWEADWKIDNITVGSIITESEGPGTAIVIELDATNMIASTIGGTTVRGSYPVEGDQIYLPNGDKAFVDSKNISTNPHRLTLKPTRQTVDLATSIVEGGTYFISDNAHPEGSGQPQGRISRVIKYKNTYQIIKERVSATGSEMTNKAYFEPVEGREGSFYLKSQQDTNYRFEVAKDGALIFGQQIDNITKNVDGLGYSVPVQGTQGLLDFGQKNGYTDEFDSSNYTIEDYDDIGRIYTKERIPRKDIMGIHGYEHFLLVENAAVEFVQNTMVDFTVKKYFGIDKMEDYNLDASDFALNIGFNFIKKGGYSYVHKSCDAFNDPNYAGTAGYDFPFLAIYMPLGKTKDQQTNTEIPSVGYHYKSLNGYNRKAELWNTGGAGPITKTDEFDIMHTNYRSEIAFHGACANQIIIQRPAA